MEKTVVIITANKAREIAEDWQQNGVLEWVEGAMEEIISASSRGFRNARIPNPNSYQLNIDKCIEALRKLGYHLCSKNSMDTYWSW